MSCALTNGRRNPRGHHRGHTSAWPMSHYISIFLTSRHSSPRVDLGNASDESCAKSLGTESAAAETQ
jgi:hypothetical protein